MNTLRPSLFRPTGRPSPPPTPAPTPTPTSPRSDAAIPADKVSRSIPKLSLAGFKKPSLTPSGSPSQAATIIQDGSYLQVLSLKLSEGISKALAQPAGPAPANESLNGRRPIPAGRGRTFGSLIAVELNASRDNPHLHKAVLRSLQRPLSALLTNLSNNLLQLLSSPEFLNPPVPTPQAPNLNPTQLHALSLATFAGELLEVFDELGLGLDSDARGDGLKSTREALVSVTTRVIHPLVAGIKTELTSLVAALEVSAPAKSTVSSSKVVAVTQHPSIANLQTAVPIYARALLRYFATTPTQSYLASLEISVVWRALVALSHRVPSQLSPPSSPNLMGKKGRPAGNTPPTTPPSTRFILKLPPSRPPSPPTLPPCMPPVVGDTRALCDLLSSLPRPDAQKETTRLAREAVNDACDGLRTLLRLLESVQTITARDPTNLARELGVLTADLPTLIALPIILNAYVFTGEKGGPRSVPSILGLPEDRYRQECLTGFGRAEECTVAVGQRVLHVLSDESGLSSDPAAEAVVLWLKAEITSVET